MVVRRRKGPAEWSPRKRFILTGDLLHPGRVVVEAKDLEDAIRKVEAGEFDIYDESKKNLGFEWNGDESTVEVED